MYTLHRADDTNPKPNVMVENLHSGAGISFIWFVPDTQSLVILKFMNTLYFVTNKWYPPASGTLGHKNPSPLLLEGSVI